MLNYVWFNHEKLYNNTLFYSIQLTSSKMSYPMPSFEMLKLERKCITTHQDFTKFPGEIPQTLFLRGCTLTVFVQISTFHSLSNSVSTTESCFRRDKVKLKANLYWRAACEASAGRVSVDVKEDLMYDLLSSGALVPKYKRALGVNLESSRVISGLRIDFGGAVSKEIMSMYHIML